MFAKKKNLRRQDFLFESAWFQTVYKPPESLHMQQFQVSDCEQCNILLFDSCAGVYIDDSKFCFIVIGPSQSSIFIRNCSYLNIICLTQQFRMRQCYHCNIILWCEAQPIIESSYDIRIAPFPRASYSAISNQLSEAKLSGWTNNWFDVFDFTPMKYIKQNKENHRQSNWELVDCIEKDRAMTQIIQKYIEQIKEKKLGLVQKYFPMIKGIGSIGNNYYAVVVIYPIPKNASMLQGCIYQARISIMPQSIDNKELNNKNNLLFLKVDNRQLSKWHEQGINACKIIKDRNTLQALQSTVFAPFRDEH